MLRHFVILQLQQRGCLQDIIFMQDSTLPHINCRVEQFLRQMHGPSAVIFHSMASSFAGYHPRDFGLWGFLKDNIYSKRPASLPDLKDSIWRHVLDIPADSRRSAVVNIVLRLEHIVEYEGGGLLSSFNATF
ncbi:hypothetical protein AVEN_377-1 [Araneus ventricosus]|uniref:Tc1-like transposase DDE domain-containing protein n=1 Tax=Araneus ventricosus TaxID=182803 RepID=A0A4Y2DUT1_ARAVE|nr:hypothetical protein AVEN_377-1 [Araneus ventricosus]